MSEDVWALPTTERKARILQEFGFQCRCAQCENNDPNEQLQSDQKEDAIWGNFYQTIGDGMLIMLNPSKAPKLCREALNLLKEEGESSPRFETIYYDAFQVCICHGDVARAKVFASLAVDAKRVCVCGMKLKAVSCHKRRSWHAGRNHTVSHFKRRNGLLRVAVAAAAAAARLQHLHTRMNGSGAERAEKEKEEKKS